MQLTLELDIPRFTTPITYDDSILLVGSCFTENMSDRLKTAKFRFMSNPNGILFNPLSVADSINRYIDNKNYTQSDLFYLNEIWNSWDHHTRFSDIDATVALNNINQSQEQAHQFIKTANVIIITVGSAFQYYLKETGMPVANNHRAPAQWFEKRLLSIETIIEALSHTLNKLLKVNPKARVLFTVSPVRHIRDGVIANNRSKARLLEAVHSICDGFENAYYFPAYELAIDILRDYRYYDIDFVHPNYLATSYIWEKFVMACVDTKTIELMKEIQEIATARSHKPRFPQTEAHQKFKENYHLKLMKLRDLLPGLDLTEELTYFSNDK